MCDSDFSDLADCFRAEGRVELIEDTLCGCAVLVVDVCVLDAGVEAVCADAAPRTTARMTAMKTNLLIMSSSWTSFITGSFGMVGLRASAIDFGPPSGSRSSPASRGVGQCCARSETVARLR